MTNPNQTQRPDLRYAQLMDAARRADSEGRQDVARAMLQEAMDLRRQLPPGQETAVLRSRALSQGDTDPMQMGALVNMASEAINRGEAAAQGRVAGQPTPATAGAPIIVEGPNGERVEFPAGTPRDVMERALSAHARVQQENQRPGVAGGLAGAATDGALFGFGDEYLAGLSAVLGVQPDGQGGANWFQYDRPIRERYGVALDAIRQEQGQFQEERPGAALGAEVMGSLLAPGIGAAGRFINAGANAGTRVARTGLLGAATGAAYGFGEGEGDAESRLRNAAPGALGGAVAGGVLGAVGEGFARGARALSRDPTTRAEAPTLEALRTTANDLYARAEALGGTMPAPATRQMVQGIKGKLQAEGFDRQLHPRLAAVLDRLDGTSGPQSLGELSILRRVAGNAAQSLQPDERRLASILIDEMDDAVSGVGGAGALAEARDVWARMRRLEAVEQAIDKAATTDNFAASLRSQFRALLNNPRRIRGFSEAERAAIREVATGTGGVRALRALGRILSPTEVSGAALAGGALFASLSGAGVLPMAVPAAGYGIKRIADALTVGAANRARGVLGDYLPPPVKNPVGLLPYASGTLGHALWGEVQQ